MHIQIQTSDMHNNLEELSNLIGFQPRLDNWMSHRNTDYYGRYIKKKTMKKKPLLFQKTSQI